MELITEFIVISALVVFQSVFGVGLLLFGTPVFLLIGHDFVSTLSLLLPVSIFISFIQLIHKKKLNKIFVKEYNIYCLPFLVLCLVITINLEYIIDIRTPVSIFLIISCIATLFFKKLVILKKHLHKRRKFFLVFIGCVHGSTNMGGGFLSLFSLLINNGDKELARNFISYGYFIMGIIQYITLLIFSLNSIEFVKLYFVFLPLLLFYPSQLIFDKISSEFFMKTINYIALIFGFFTLFVSIK